jgi:hypothetical protein
MEDDTILLHSQKTSIEALEKLIKEVREGKVMEFVGLATQPDGNYHFVGGTTENRHTMAGMLLEMAIERLKDDEE